MRLEHLQPPEPGLAVEQLLRIAPQAVGDLLPGAEADPRHERLAGADGVQVRVRSHEPERVEGAVQDLQPVGEIFRPGIREPGARLHDVIERRTDIDDGRPSSRDRGRLRLR